MDGTCRIFTLLHLYMCIWKENCPNQVRRESTNNLVALVWVGIIISKSNLVYPTLDFGIPVRHTHIYGNRYTPFNFLEFLSTSTSVKSEFWTHIPLHETQISLRPTASYCQDQIIVIIKYRVLSVFFPMCHYLVHFFDCHVWHLKQYLLFVWGH